jgi:hypothetical protein
VHRLGEVSASLQFFRMIGSTVGLAVFGSVLNNRFTANLGHDVPAPVVHGLRVAKLDNANALGSTQAQKAIALIVGRVSAALGEPAARLGALVTHGLRLSLEQAINTLFVVSTVIGVAGLLVVVFLPEVRLRSSHNAEELQGGVEEGLESATAPEHAIDAAQTVER